MKELRLCPALLLVELEESVHWQNARLDDEWRARVKANLAATHARAQLLSVKHGGDAVLVLTPGRPVQVLLVEEPKEPTDGG